MHYIGILFFHQKTVQEKFTCIFQVVAVVFLLLSTLAQAMVEV
jgi:hypothetical protein